MNLPTSWTPHVPMQRIILHWTAGGHKANDTDKRAYHFLVEGDGNLVRGNASVTLNSGGIKPGYAAHTLNCNSGSIGVSLCCMAGAVESPFNAGRAPMTEKQFHTMIGLVRELATRYNIPVTRRTILSHAEVQTTLGIQQRNKWDYTRLAFMPDIRGALVIGDFIRDLIQKPTGATAVPAQPVPAQPIPAGGIGVVKTNGSPLIMRDGPDGKDKGGRIPNGTRLEITNHTATWLEVKTPAGYVGWVSAAFVEIVDGPPAEEPTKPNPMRQKIADIRALLDELEQQL